MSLLPSYIGTGTQAVAAGGTAEQLSTTSIPCYSVTVTAYTGNTNPVFVGDSTVDKTSPKQIILNARDTFSLDIDDVSKVWVDATTNGEGVDFVYTAPIAPNVQSPLYAG